MKLACNFNRIWKHIIIRWGDSDSESEAEDEVVQDNQHQPAAAAGNNDEINSEGETVVVKSKDEMKQSGPAKNLALSDEGVALKWLSLTLLIMISFYWPCN